MIATNTTSTWYKCALVSKESSQISITGHMNLFPQSTILHYCEETRQKVHSSHKTVTKADQIFPLARSFPNHATYGYAFNKKLCSKGNREFVLIGTRCWMDKLLFLFLPRYEINHMTKRKGCKQPTQARNRSFQGQRFSYWQFCQTTICNQDTTKLFQFRYINNKASNGSASLQGETLTCNSCFCLRSL